MSALADTAGTSARNSDRRAAFAVRACFGMRSAFSSPAHGGVGGGTAIATSDWTRTETHVPG
jgi:hypothetical protein